MDFILEKEWATRGLSAAEAAKRVAEEGPNELPSARPRSRLRVAIDALKEPMFLLLVAIGAIYFALGSLEEGMALSIAVVVVILITLYQEQRTERALQALRDLSSPRALVIRDSVAQRIAGREVVRGDLVALAEGDRVPADGVVLSSNGLEIDESLLTGESGPVRKTAGTEGATMQRPGGDDLPFVYSGTLVTNGRGFIRVLSAGARTELGRIGKALQTLETERTQLQKESDRAVRIFAVAGILVSALVAAVYAITRGNLLRGILAGLTLGISMVPEEFPVILTIFLAIGAWRISRKQVLTRRVPAIETLGAATVLCADKTGTLTQNAISIAHLYRDGNFQAAAGSEGSLAPSFRDLILTGMLASAQDTFDPIDRAFHAFGEKHLNEDGSPLRSRTILREYPLSREFLAMGRAWVDSRTGGMILAAKGAPETIAEVCHFGPAEYETVAQAVQEMAVQGLRVLGIARCTSAEAAPPDALHEADFEFVGLVGLADPLRADVPGAVEQCHRAGIRVVMITGDYPATAITISRQAGIHDPERLMTGAELERLSPEELHERIGPVQVFARVMPEQKLRIVEGLKASGEIVAMTGDGVNDAPALKAAHIGIAMGKRGTDVAREAAALILLDDRFASVVDAIRLGRRIYDNIRKAMRYAMAIHVPIAGMSLLPVLFGWPLVLLPVHIVFLELIIDPACSTAFEAEPEEPDVMERPPRNPQARLFSHRFIRTGLLQGLGVLVMVAAVFVVALYRGQGEPEARALTFTTLIIANLALIWSNRSTRRPLWSAIATKNRALWIITAGAAVFLAAALCLPPMRTLFQFSALHAADIAICLAAGIASVLWFEVMKALQRRERFESRA